VTPDVFGALRDANDVLGPFLRARSRQYRNHCHTQQYAGGIGKRVLYWSHLQGIMSITPAKVEKKTEKHKIIFPFSQIEPIFM
jgi:hypothetical protein